MNMINAIKNEFNQKKTENGADAYSSTLNAVLDLFAFGAAYRSRSDEDVIKLFREALLENEELAMKCLYYIRDIRESQGERRFFRVCMNWLADNAPEVAKRNMEYIKDYGRFDDYYCFVGTQLEEDAFSILRTQTVKDCLSEYPSLCAKWLHSEDTSSKKNAKLGTLTRKYFHLTSREYRQLLSKLRNRLKVVERLLSDKRFDEIEFDRLPSQAGLKYINCFSSREELADRYAEFVNNKKKVNANVLYPYECVHKALEDIYDPVKRQMVNNYWENLPNLLKDGEASNYMCVCDTSSSMHGRPIEIAISLSLYFAERAKGPFHNHYISFASRPQLIECTGVDFCDKVRNIYGTNLVDNTNLEAVFDLLLKIAKSGQVAPEDFVKNLFIISDMEIDEAQDIYRDWFTKYQREDYLKYNSIMEKIRNNWENETNIPFPRLYYWNVDARNNTVLELDNVSFISGASPNILKQVLTGKTGKELMLETLLSKRYEVIH